MRAHFAGAVAQSDAGRAPVSGNQPESVSVRTDHASTESANCSARARSSPNEIRRDGFLSSCAIHMLNIMVIGTDSREFEPITTAGHLMVG